MKAHMLQRKCACGGSSAPCKCPDKKKVQRNAKAARSPETIPPIVDRVLASSGQTLGRDVRAHFEPRFGVDFSSVRVHTDKQAAESAHAVNANAYTVGHDIVFAAGRYSPGTRDGTRLLAHELTHVVQQKTGQHAYAATKQVSNPRDASEIEADRIADADVNLRGSTGTGRVVPFRPTHETSPSDPVVHRSIIGGLLGGLVGAAGGALAGSLLGPVGAVVGGIAGFIGGALGADKLTTKARALTLEEIEYAREIFLDTIDFTKVRIARGSLLSVGAPKTIGNTIHLPATEKWGLFVGDTTNLTDPWGLTTLIHELGHVWQYQNGGLAYAPLALIAQFKAFVTKGSSSYAYEWKDAVNAGLPWEEWNPEQQASAIDNYNTLLRLSKDSTRVLRPEAQKDLSILTGYMQFVHKKMGMPTFRRPKKRGISPK